MKKLKILCLLCLSVTVSSCALIPNEVSPNLTNGSRIHSGATVKVLKNFNCSEIEIEINGRDLADSFSLSAGDVLSGIDLSNEEYQISGLLSESLPDHVVGLPVLQSDDMNLLIMIRPDGELLSSEGNTMLLDNRGGAGRQLFDVYVSILTFGGALQNVYGINPEGFLPVSANCYPKYGKLFDIQL